MGDFVNKVIGTSVVQQRSSAGPGFLTEDVFDEIADLEPDVYPLTTMIMKAQKEKTISFEYFWYNEDLFGWRKRTCTADVAQAGLVITVDDGSAVAPGYLVKVNTTREVFRIRTVDNAGTPGQWTIDRAVGETAAPAGAASIPNGAELTVFSMAAAQGSGAPGIVTTLPTRDFNYTQIFKEPFGVDGTSDAMEPRAGGKLLTREEVKAAQRFKLKMELAFLHGERAYIASDPLNPGKPLTLTRGIFRVLEAEPGVFIGNAGNNPMTETLWDTITETGFRFPGGNKKRKFGVVSRRLATQFNAFARGRIQIVKDTSTYGISVNRLVGVHGTVDLIVHDMLDGTEFSKYGIFLEPNSFKYRYLQGRDVRVKKNIQDNDADEVKHQYEAEVGFQIMTPKHNFLVKNVAA